MIHDFAHFDNASDGMSGGLASTILWVAIPAAGLRII